MSHSFKISKKVLFSLNLDVAFSCIIESGGIGFKKSKSFDKMKKHSLHIHLHKINSHFNQNDEKCQFYPKSQNDEQLHNFNDRISDQEATIAYK